MATDVQKVFKGTLLKASNSYLLSLEGDMDRRLALLNETELKKYDLLQAELYRRGL